MGRKNTIALEEVELNKELIVGGESIQIGFPDHHFRSPWRR